MGMLAGGSVGNQAGASITGVAEGVFSNGAASAITNAGSITATGSGGAGADIEAGGSVNNAAGAVLTGQGYGVFGKGGPTTVVNAGTIGGGSLAVALSADAGNKVVVDPGAVFNGAVNGGTGTLDLAAGSGSGSIGDVNAGSFAFYGFGQIAIDSGASWAFKDVDSATSLRDDGTLTLAGSLTAGTLDAASRGTVALGAGSSLDLAASTGADASITFLGASLLTIDHYQSFGTGIGTAGYAGDKLNGFGAGDTIDLKDFASAGAAAVYDASTGTLALSNGAGNAADLSFGASSLGTGSFHAGERWRPGPPRHPQLRRRTISNPQRTIPAWPSVVAASGS